MPKCAQLCTKWRKPGKAVWSRKTRHFPRFAAMKKKARIASEDRCSIQLSYGRNAFFPRKKRILRFSPTPVVVGLHPIYTRHPVDYHQIRLRQCTKEPVKQQGFKGRADRKIISRRNHSCVTASTPLPVTSLIAGGSASPKSSLAKPSIRSCTVSTSRARNALWGQISD